MSRELQFIPKKPCGCKKHDHKKRDEDEEDRKDWFLEDGKSDDGSKKKWGNWKAPKNDDGEDDAKSEADPEDDPEADPEDDPEAEAEAKRKPKCKHEKKCRQEKKCRWVRKCELEEVRLLQDMHAQGSMPLQAPS